MKFFLVLFLFLSLPINSCLHADSRVDNYLDLASLFKESGEYEKALDILDEAATFSKDKKLIRYSGKLEFLYGLSSDALLIFNSLKNKNWFDFLYLGLIYEDLEDTDSAISSYLKSLKLKKNSIALFRLAKLHYRQREYQKASGYYGMLLSFDPSIRLANYYMGECLYSLGQYEAAHKYLSKAANFYPKAKDVSKKLVVVKKKIPKDFFIAQAAKKEAKRKKVKMAVYLPKEEIPSIKIGLGRNLEEFSFSCAGEFIVTDGKVSFTGRANKFYTIILKKGKVILRDYESKQDYKEFLFPCKISSLKLGSEKPPFYVLDIVYGEGNFWHKEIDRVYRGDLEVILKNKKLTLINILSTEEYLYGVLSAEIPASSHPEALRAQSVAARTLIFRNIGRHRRQGFDFCADVHCQVYQGISAETLSTRKAVDDTKGEVVTYADKPVETFYHANCGGCLAADVFGDEEYLVSKTDSKDIKFPASSYEEEAWFFNEPKVFCYSGKNSSFRWQRVYDAQDFFIVFGYKLSNLKSILAKDKGDCFHYKAIDVITKNVKKTLSGGLKIRNYFDKLRSSAFKVEIKLSAKRKPKMLFFWGAGFGHGTGMCQRGAMNMAKKSYTYQQILSHYYTGIEIKQQYQ